MTLAPELEARVRAVADRSGLPPETALSRLLDAALADEEQQFQETVVALRVSMGDFDFGRFISLAEWRTDSRAWLDAHRQPSSVHQEAGAIRRLSTRCCWHPPRVRPLTPNVTVCWPNAWLMLLFAGSRR